MTIFQAVLASERHALEAVTRKVERDPEVIIRACATLLGTAAHHDQRVIVSGIGKAGLIGRKVAATLSSTGTAAIFLHPVEALHGDLGFVRSTDCAVLLSYSGETVELIRLADELRRVACPFVAITRSRDSTLGKLAAVCLETGEVQEACYLGLAPTSSTTVMLALGDALALAVAKAKGFREEDFARYHPAGALGLRFRSVESTMRSGGALVCVSPSAPVQEVVREVSRAKVGAAVLVRPDRTLLGIFTDGDLRRALLREGAVLEKPVEAFASIPCHSVTSGERVSDAMKLFQNTRAEELPVVDKRTREVIGLLCLKDITLF